MGKFGCSCGHSISLNSIPEMNQAILITDIALDDDAGNSLPQRLPHRRIIECDLCGTLWIESSPQWDVGAEWLSFKPNGPRLRFRDDYGKGYRSKP